MNTDLYQRYHLKSARVALAAMLHDLGKIAERARIDTSSVDFDAHVQQYCRHNKNSPNDPGWFSHKHAAYTALAMDIVQPHLPPLVGNDVAPYAAWAAPDVDDSLVNAAAMHHKPDTFLQWITAVADRIASGFEREEFEKYNKADENTSNGLNHYTSRQLTLFEQISISGSPSNKRNDLKYRYGLSPLSVDALFPTKSTEAESKNKKQAQAEYNTLWQTFIEALQSIPANHRSSLPLWLDHFDTLWQTIAHAVPSATAFNTRPDVSLYDHSHTAAALAVATWRWHDEQGQTDGSAHDSLARYQQDKTQKYLLIQGDFFGIQNFIFAPGATTQKNAARVLRGRSFYVALLTECAALLILDQLGLPPTSQVINSAGKFLILAPNTPEVHAQLELARATLDNWFLDNLYGTSGIGLAATPATAGDFLGSQYKQLIRRLFEQLENSKLRQFNLPEREQAIQFDGYLDKFDNNLGVCAIDERAPATHLSDNGEPLCDLSADLIDIGRNLVADDLTRILLTREQPTGLETLRLNVFGYSVSFVSNEAASGKFGPLAQKDILARLWDISLPADDSRRMLWHGYARRNIAAWVPRVTESDRLQHNYIAAESSTEELRTGAQKTFDLIAAADCHIDKNNRPTGIQALSTLKGDIDNLGLVFQQGLSHYSFAKMAALSRQVNAFFTVYVPWLCAQHPKYRNVYTVFAGGDDFFLIGPWKTTMELATQLREDFSAYVAFNTELHFSCGITTHKSGHPVSTLAHVAEAALDSAKSHNPNRLSPAPKNAVTAFGETVSWEEFEHLLQVSSRLDDTREQLGLSTGFMYGLLSLVAMAEDDSDPRNTMWHSKLRYRIARMLEQKKIQFDKRKTIHEQLALELSANGIERYRGRYRIALFTHLYQQRR